MNTARQDAEWLGMQQSCPIHRPSHYTQGRKFEVIDVLEDWAGRAPNPTMGFNQGQCLKYLGRLWDKKNALEDAKKSRWYLDRLISHLEEADKPKLDYDQVTTFHGREDYLGQSEWAEPSRVFVPYENGFEIPFDGSDEVTSFDLTFEGDYEGPHYAPHPDIPCDSAVD